MAAQITFFAFPTSVVLVQDNCIGLAAPACTGAKVAVDEPRTSGGLPIKVSCIDDTY